MTHNPLILTFDCGTQSMRAMLVDKFGNIVAKVQRKYEPAYHSKYPNWAEQSVEFYWQHLCEASKTLKKENKKIWDDIICVTLSTFRDSYTCMDKDGNFIRDIILWLDQRMAKCEKPLPLKSRVAFRLVGMSEAVRVQRKITKSNWIKENEPQLWAKTHKYVSVNCALNYLLTGEVKESVAANIGHIPFDYKSKTWKKESDVQFPVFGIEKEKLCYLVPPLSTIGHITQKAAELTGIKEGLPLIATGSDKGCESLGTGVVDKNAASLSFGTSASIQISTDKYVEPTPFLPAYPSVMPHLFNPEVQIYRGYWMLTWFIREFAQKEEEEAKKQSKIAEDLLNAKLSEVPPGCEGLTLLPYWAPQLKQPEGRGAVIGFNSRHSRIHIYRAIIEGINFALYDAMLTLEKRSGNKIEYLTISGGGSQSDEICQITADMFGLPVKRIQTYEATGLGSSMAAFVAMGVYDDIHTAMQSMIRYKPTIQPNMQNHEIYKSIYKHVYKNMNNRLRPLYLKLYSLSKHQ